MPLHMIRLVPQIRHLTQWAEDQGLRLRNVEDDLGYALHALLKAAFGDKAPRPFVFRATRTGFELLGYSAHDKAALAQHASAFASPEVAEAVGLGSIAGKMMPDTFSTGARLGFLVRARPTIRTDRAGDRKAVAERDAYRPEAPAGTTRAQTYADWLSARLSGGGARAEMNDLEAYRSLPVLRRDASRALRRVDGPEAMLTGVLVVEEPEKFAGLLAGGVGRHAAFGFGMLLLRPA